MAIAMSPSVTVSIAAEISGMFRLMPRVSRVRVSVFDGQDLRIAGNQQHVVEGQGFLDAQGEGAGRRVGLRGVECHGRGPFRYLGGPT